MRCLPGLPRLFPLLLWPIALTASTIPASSHHGPDGFHNNYPHPPHQGFWRWKWEQVRDGVPQAPPGGWKIPVVATDAARLRQPPGPQLTWIGHATFLLQVGGMNILTDPQFSERASPIPFAGPHRAVALPIDIDSLPSIDVVLISHNHYDHLDRDTVKRLAAPPGGSPLFLVPLGLRAWFIENGIDRVAEYDWWQSHGIADARFTLVPVQHWSKRTLWDENQSLWGGWVMEVGGLRIIHTGDLGLSRDTQDVGQRFRAFDLALIPIGSYAPPWFMRTMHVDVPEALRVRDDLHAARAIGMHWGTFEGLSDEPLDEPPKALERLRDERGVPRETFDVMKIGETRPIVAARER